MNNAYQEDSTPKNDNIRHPKHYENGSVETIDIIEDVTNKMFESKEYTGPQIAAMANVIKYTNRFVDKNGIEDLKKARNYLNRVIDGEWFEGE